MQAFKHGTWLQDEHFAYTAQGSQRRKGRAVFPDGKIRTVYAGVPDTFFSIPAHAWVKGRYIGGYVTVDDSLVDCPHCHGNWKPEGQEQCKHCGFGLVDSLTYGALVFRPMTRYKELTDRKGQLLFA